jgi:hypothetical protein
MGRNYLPRIADEILKENSKPLEQYGSQDPSGVEKPGLPKN